MRRLLWLLIATLLTAAGAAAATTTATTRPHGPAVVVLLRGMIDDYSRVMLQKRFEEARKTGARTIILELNSPGGAVDASQEISRFIKNQKDLYVIAFVNPYALSGGAMVAVAANEIVMAPGAMMGASSVIAQDQQGQIQNLPKDVREKFQSPIIEEYLDSAKGKYDPLLVRAMVESEIVVHWMQSPGGQRRFVDEKEYLALKKEGWVPVPGMDDPVDSGTTLLTVKSERAIKLGLASAEATSAAELAQQRGLLLAARLEPTFGDQVIQWLNHPYLRWFLLTIFMTSLYAALHAPGHGFAEVLAVVTLTALVGVPMLTGYAQWWEVVMILLGIILLALEVFVIPGFGIAGISGIVLVLAGIIFTFVPAEPASFPGVLPRLPGTWALLRKALTIVTLSMLCSLLLSLWLRRFLPSLPYFNRLILSTPGQATVGGPIAPDAVWPPLGAAGRAVTDLRPGGSAEFADGAQTRVVSVVADSGFVPRGSTVVVRQVEGAHVVVRQTASA